MPQTPQDQRMGCLLQPTPSREGRQAHTTEGRGAAWAVSQGILVRWPYHSRGILSLLHPLVRWTLVFSALGWGPEEFRAGADRGPQGRRHSHAHGLQTRHQCYSESNNNRLSKMGHFGFPGGAVVKNLPANAGDTGSSPAPGRSRMPQSN